MRSASRWHRERRTRSTSINAGLSSSSDHGGATPAPAPLPFSQDDEQTAWGETLAFDTVVLSTAAVTSKYYQSIEMLEVMMIFQERMLFQEEEREQQGQGVMVRSGILLIQQQESRTTRML
jgi:hypothetical protein